MKTDKKMKTLLLLLPSILLAGCKETSELYNIGEFFDSHFENNYYANDVFSDVTEMEEITLESDAYFNSDPKGANWAKFGKKGPDEEFFYYGTDPETKEPVRLSQMTYTQAFENNDSAYIGTDFGRSKCMAKQDESFKYGMLSKLYDGQLFCYGYHNSALVQTPSNGFGHHFSKSLQTGKYFMVSMRGGSTLGNARFSYLDFNVTFYKESDVGIKGTSITLRNVDVQTDSGGEACTFIGFKFSESLPDFNPEGIIGYRISYSNLHDVEGISFDGKTAADEYWGLLVYELMFVDATWR